ncbi:MAG: hypothetical protein H0X34_10330 [Chthoniobacterales bacterium]|nr:hypothetical protein [Chthoniobacterales bacterium]
MRARFGARGIVPYWSAATLPKAVVGLSGPYDLSSRQGDNPDDVQVLAADVDNYTNTNEDPPGYTYQYSVSPVALVAAATAIPPIRLYATQLDPVPHQQAEEMRDALRDHGGIDYIEYTMQNSSPLHAFEYWHTLNPTTGKYVSTEVIDFFKSHLP